jgi:hypothetical protein
MAGRMDGRINDVRKAEPVTTARSASVVEDADIIVGISPSAADTEGIVSLELPRPTHGLAIAVVRLPERVWRHYEANEGLRPTTFELIVGGPQALGLSSP